MSSSEMMGGDTPENSSDTTEVNNGVEGSSSESGDLEGLSPTSDDNSPIMEARKGFLYYYATRVIVHCVLVGICFTFGVTLR